MSKISVAGQINPSLSAELEANADVEVVTESADAVLIDCSSGGGAALENALESGSPILLYQPDEIALAALEKLTGSRPAEGSQLVGIAKLTSRQGQVSYQMLDGSDLQPTSGQASDRESALLKAPDTADLLSALVSQMAGRLHVNTAKPLLRDASATYSPGNDAWYWNISNSWGPATYTLGHDDDKNVMYKLNGSVQQQTPSLMLNADLHIYYADAEPVPYYVVYAKFTAICAAGYRLANTGDARGFFLSKIFMDFGFEASEGKIVPIGHIPGNYEGEQGFVFPLSTPRFRITARTATGAAATAFTPQDSVTWNIKGWRIHDESAGNQVKACFHQHDGWDSWIRQRQDFGSWWQEAFGGKYGGKVVGMPDTSFATITTEAVGAWRLEGKFNGKHEIYMTVRPGPMGFHQEMAFIHNLHSCNGRGNINDRHHDITWADFWTGSPWYLKLSDLPKPAGKK
jgi:hypothetical protein